MSTQRKKTDFDYILNQVPTSSNDNIRVVTEKIDQIPAMQRQIAKEAALQEAMEWYR
jgi:hypothetical protein